MCGRFSRTASWKNLADLFDVADAAVGIWPGGTDAPPVTEVRTSSAGGIRRAEKKTLSATSGDLFEGTTAPDRDATIAAKSAAAGDETPFPGVAPLRPTYNVAPTQEVPVLLHDGTERRLVACRWGLVPAWTKDLKKATRPINARSETIAEKPTFRAALKSRRCLIPADGFYEWTQDGTKTPMYITRRDGQPFVFAGLWEEWRGQDPPLRTCTIITTEANALMAAFHHRMPVILDREQWDAWLDPDNHDIPALLAMLKPYPPDLMQARAVSRTVNSPRNTGPECIAEPI